LIVYLRNFIRPLLGGRYIAAVEARVYIEGTSRQMIPDLEIRQAPTPRKLSGATAVLDAPNTPIVVQVPGIEISESYINILDRQSKLNVVTVIELVSPSNKRSGTGHSEYLAKQQEVLHSQAHLVEIDLLRSGIHTLAVPEEVVNAQAAHDYLMSVNRAQGNRDTFELYLCQLRNRLPSIKIPLAAGDDDIVVDLQAVLNQTYDDGQYDLRLGYTQPCIPRLSADDQQWASDLIAAVKAKSSPASP
jgi:hypothetical protein